MIERGSLRRNKWKLRLQSATKDSLRRFNEVSIAIGSDGERIPGGSNQHISVMARRIHPELSQSLVAESAVRAEHSGIPDALE